MVNEDPATIPRDPENTIKHGQWGPCGGPQRPKHIQTRSMGTLRRSPETQTNTVNEDPATVLGDPNTFKTQSMGTLRRSPETQTGQQTEPATRSMRTLHHSPETQRPVNKQTQTRSNKETQKSATVDYRPNNVGAWVVVQIIVLLRSWSKLSRTWPLYSPVTCEVWCVSNSIEAPATMYSKTIL